MISGKGFTLADLMVSVLCIGIVAAMAIPSCMEEKRDVEVTVEVTEGESVWDKIEDCKNKSCPLCYPKPACDTATELREGEFEIVARSSGRSYSGYRYIEYGLIGDTAILNKALGTRMFATISSWRVVTTKVKEIVTKTVTSTSKDKECRK